MKGYWRSVVSWYLAVCFAFLSILALALLLSSVGPASAAATAPPLYSVPRKLDRGTSYCLWVGTNPCRHSFYQRPLARHLHLTTSSCALPLDSPRYSPYNISV